MSYTDRQTDYLLSAANGITVKLDKQIKAAALLQFIEDTHRNSVVTVTEIETETAVFVQNRTEP